MPEAPFGALEGIGEVMPVPRNVVPWVTRTLLLVVMLAGGALAAEVGSSDADGAAVVPAAVAQRALTEALRFAEVTYEAGGVSRQGVAYLLGGRIGVDRYLEAVAQGKVPGVDVGVDASGLVVQAYLAADPALRFRTGDGAWGRDASSSSLYRWNVRIVPLDELRPGDLIFFQNEEGRVSGVGIFERREGPNVYYLVASAAQGRVIRTFNNVGNDYWKSRFLAAGQLLDAAR